VYEIKPKYPSGDSIVWQWHVWDHLIQDYDATKLNYGVVKNHPELISAAGDQTQLPAFWNHMNSIDYNPQYDEILMSVRGNSEIWVIDHSTTTDQAAGHAGGKRGKGGDLLYRWGNPLTYGAGTTANQKLYQQHDAEWIPAGNPGAGNITVFNNGLSRNYSSIDEITPPVDTAGAYPLATGAAFAPTTLTWTYIATPPTSLYAAAISGAQRLPNGNTIIDDGTHGTFTEVTSGGQVVWKYLCPVAANGPLGWADSIPDDPVRAGEKMNAVFRVYKYPLNYAGFSGRDMTPGAYVELYKTSVSTAMTYVPVRAQLYQNYPNPFNPTTRISYTIGRVVAPSASEGPAVSGESGAGRGLQVASSGSENQSSGLSAYGLRLTVYDVLGREIAVLVDGVQSPGRHEVQFDGSRLSSGTYIYRLDIGGESLSRVLTLVK
jgi:hypothetical protein